MRLFSKFLPLTNEVQPSGDVMKVVFSPSEAWQRQSAQIVQQEIERIMSFMIQGLTVLTGKAFNLESITMTCPRPALVPDTLSELTARLEFNVQQNSFSFLASVLQLPLIHHNDQLLLVLEGHARKILSELQPESFTDVVKRKLIDYFHENQSFCQIEWVAEQTNLGVRTLQRKLKAESCSFTDLVDEVKLNFAKTYLADPQLSIAEVAFLLGYNEISAFYHFFKKHTQQTPKQYQRQ